MFAGRLQRYLDHGDTNVLHDVRASTRLRPRMSTNLPRSTLSLGIDRSGLVKQVEKKLNAAGVCCIYGMPSTGKSVLAEQLWQNNPDECVSRWIRASTV